MKLKELKHLLDDLYDKFNRIEFIEHDPIAIPHRFSSKEDIEIAAFFSAILAWGQRSQILKSLSLLMNMMEQTPFDFVENASSIELKRLDKFYYRTFKNIDALFFIRALRIIYETGGLEKLFTDAYSRDKSIISGLIQLHNSFNAVEHETRSMKHIASVQKGSSAKRLNMFLRWMVRSDERKVDFGLWKQIPASALYIPLDVHSGRIAREFNLLERNQNDWKAVEELTLNLRKIDPIDPVKYDFALFGFGVNQK